MPATRIAAILTERKLTVATAESCTGGLLAKLLTDIPGSSAYFIEGLITYADSAKERLLGVPAKLLDEQGAVSEQVAIAMALGCRAKSGADFALSITGIAGPGGGTPDKPVGMVYLGLADKSGCRAKQLHLNPALSREQIRQQSAVAAISMLTERLSEQTA